MFFVIFRRENAGGISSRSIEIGAQNRPGIPKRFSKRGSVSAGTRAGCALLEGCRRDFSKNLGRHAAALKQWHDQRDQFGHVGGFGLSDMLRFRARAGFGSVSQLAGKICDVGYSLAGERSRVGLRSARHRGGRCLYRRHEPGRNFATVNHLLINALVLEAFQEVIPGVHGDLVLLHQPQYRSAGGRGRQDGVGPSQGSDAGISRRASCLARDAICRDRPSDPAARQSAGRFGRDGGQRGSGKELLQRESRRGAQFGRKEAIRRLDQAAVDAELDACDILTNCRQYPKDEAPAAYKDFAEVLRSVEAADLATQVARLEARFVIKDGDKADD